jgi:predicted HTH domain antitoxin
MRVEAKKDDEVNPMRTIEIKYPDAIPAILNLSPDKFEQEAKFALAVKLYEMGRLTSGQAARLAGVSRVAFLLDCRRYGASSVDWDNTEIDAEFADINR